MHPKGHVRSPALWDGCALTHCGGCGAAPSGKVLDYQRSGKRVILSVSACTPLTPTMWYTALSVCITARIPLPSSLCMHLTAPIRLHASRRWAAPTRTRRTWTPPRESRSPTRSGTYLGGRWQGWRPFGPKAVIDATDLDARPLTDPHTRPHPAPHASPHPRPHPTGGARRHRLDLEQTPSACNAPSSDACTQVVEGWFHFVRPLRSLMDADTRKEYLLTADRSTPSTATRARAALAAGGPSLTATCRASHAATPALRHARRHARREEPPTQRSELSRRGRSSPPSTSSTLCGRSSTRRPSRSR